MTVAHYIASKGIIPPKQWKVDSLNKTQNGNTIALILASKGIIPPTEYEHDTTLFYSEYQKYDS